MPTGVAPVGLEEQVVSCEVEQSEKAVLCCPSPVRRVPGVEETEAVVWHPVRGCQTGVGEHSWIVLRSEPVGVIERACLEQDSDGHRPIASGNFEAPVTIDQLVVPEIRLDFVAIVARSEEHTSELQSRGHLVCRLLLEKKNERKQGYGRSADYAYRKSA